ncbi:Dirigent protein [Actinidia chinensis var. chinensis]|uniref:Dirigent protein n=1 Tax=Actinidia chinensis var. chinensis TaxID=1590841 RepID=A0A2R6R6W6_ACTCC|nr:Dirigent protein [Actinidia chinensis var. chinensis]
MGKLATILFLCSMVIVQGIDEGPKAVEHWFKNLSQKKEKVTKLHFFFHDTISGKNPTAIQVAQANTTSQSPTLFGSVFVMDDPLTVGPEPNSTIIGRAQGIYASSGLEEFGLHMTLNYVFTSGKFNGSTLSILGWNPILHTYREMAIVGGFGIFRLARGIATAKTYWFNATAGDAIVEYHVIVHHYE